MSIIRFIDFLYKTRTILTYDEMYMQLALLILLLLSIDVGNLHSVTDSVSKIQLVA
jgi:hypothetical protein